MVIETLRQIFERDLLKLKEEIRLYKDPSNLWKIEKSIKNSGGNLCLHLIGNLKTYIGHGLAQTGYVRDRPFEFSGKNVARDKLYQEIDETIEVINSGLNNLTNDQLQDDFPIIIWETPTNMAFTIIHLQSHLNYHLGQINYHRRILD